MYQMYQFTFKSKYGIPIAIVAREESTALEIIDVWNTGIPKEQFWKRKIFGYKKKVYVEVEPYIIEQDQLKTSKDLLEKRLEKWKKQ